MTAEKATKCWCGVTIDPGNQCCRHGHLVYDDDGEPLSTQLEAIAQRRWRNRTIRRP